MERFEQKKCWQDERLDRIFNKEAASVDRATFLATHMPLHNLEYQHMDRRIANQNEEAFLDELQHCSEADLHTFAVVQGAPGTGKSHLIRWLKERYRTPDGQPAEQVLFIERASASLSGTLEQIIKSESFEDAAMREQLDRLQKARSGLSDDALANTLLTGLRNATEDEELALPRWLKERDLTYLLQDVLVQDELKKPGGPIDRLVRFLRSGSRSGIGIGEVPHFEELDFNFDRRVREQLGYKRVQNLADRLSGEWGYEKRQDLVSVLNGCIRYAIGQATALTGDDFKQIFTDLRRSLYRQGRSLVLFIEDITVFTGIDRGLLDVLVTQHKNENGQELCRLISIVGVTDSYYVDQVPDNIKQRMTYHIVLKPLSETGTDDLENLASRYLNALRLPEEKLARWASESADLEELPNACEDCQWRTTCHRAFGTHTIQSDHGRTQEIGLYPFNRRSLHTFYQHIDTAKTARTQRTFLHSVLHYILQSHAAYWPERGFPPGISELGGDFTGGFSLDKPLQRNTIQTQGGVDRERIFTLVTIWGNCTIDAVEGPGQSTVGGISKEVFRAFGLRVIAGESVTAPTSFSIRTSAGGSTSAVAPGPTQPSGRSVINEQLQAAGAQVSVPASVVVDDKQKKYRDDITSWLNEKKKLQRDGEYKDLLWTFIGDAIDWDSYGIGPFQIKEVNSRRYIWIEDQAGTTQSSDRLELLRSPELAYVLLGLISQKDWHQGTGHDVIGAYVSWFSIWLQKHEPEIVDFVRRPNHDSPDALSLLQVVVLDCLFLACLQGKLQASYNCTQDLFVDLMRFCRDSGQKDTETVAQQWASQLKRAGEEHTESWISLMKNQALALDEVQKLCADCLQLLNRTQGGSTGVKFVDAAAGIEILQELRDKQWKLPELGINGGSRRDSWNRALKVYRAIQENFGNILQNEQKMVRTQLDKLEIYVSQDSYADVFRAIKKMDETARTSGRGMSFTIQGGLSSADLRGVVNELKLLRKASAYEEVLLRSSQAGGKVSQIKKYLAYFEEFVTQTQKVKAGAEVQLKKLNQEASVVAAQQEAQKLYQEIEQALHSLDQPGEEK